MSRPEPPKAAPPGVKVALVVDDDPTMRKLIATTLGTQFRVHVAEGASQAMALLATIAPPDLLVCDVAMPGIDGLQFVRQLRAIPEYARTPVILLTAKGGALDVVAGINAGARFYVTKPFNPRELLEKATRATSTPKA